LRIKLIYILSKKEMITKQRADILGLSIALKNQKLDKKYSEKLLDYLKELQKEETMEILLENSNIKRVIKAIEEERGI